MIDLILRAFVCCLCIILESLVEKRRDGNMDLKFLEALHDNFSLSLLHLWISHDAIRLNLEQLEGNFPNVSRVLLSPSVAARDERLKS